MAAVADGLGRMVNKVVKDEEDLYRKWVNSIESKLDVEPVIIKASSVSCSIHRVPQCFLQHDKKAYMPQIISIGPFHYDKRKDGLRAMEEHKWRYLRAIVTRETKGTEDRKDRLQLYLKAIKELEEIARECYSETINLDSNSFVEMMLLDGCFIIELFCRSVHEWDDEDEQDPLLSLIWLKHTLMCDLLKLENQIPFIILQKLFYLMNISGASLVERAVAFFNDMLPKNRMINYSRLQAGHLLHLLHSSRIPTDTYDDNSILEILPKNRKINHSCLQAGHLLHLLHPSRISTGVYDDNSILEIEYMIHSASELQRAGIKFKKRDTKSSFMDIKFHNGVIEIPPFKVIDSTSPILLNLVAFEQCYSQCNPYYTAYTTFMDFLINTNLDVGILCRRGIIDNWLGSDKDVATIFNKLGREVIISPRNFYLLGIFSDINNYYEARCHKWRGILMRNYFNSPWAIISATAATILLILTFIQTLFTVFPKFCS